MQWANLNTYNSYICDQIPSNNDLKSAFIAPIDYVGRYLKLNDRENKWFLRPFLTILPMFYLMDRKNIKYYWN